MGRGSILDLYRYEHFLFSKRTRISSSFHVKHDIYIHEKMYLQAALVTAGIQRPIIFFTAIFPQFIDPGSAYVYQSSILLLLCTLIAFLCFMLYAISGQKVISIFSRARIAKHVQRIIGGTLIGAGIGLAVSHKY